MILEKNTPGGGILTGSCFTNRVGRKKNITPWHKRRTAKGTKKDTTAPSSLPIEVTKSSEPIPTLTSTPHMSQDDSTSDYLSPFSPPTPRTSLPTAYSTGFIQPGPNTSFLEEDFVWDPIWDVDQPSPCTESGAFSGANWDLSKPVASGFHGQLGSEPTPGDNQYSAPPFRCANMPAQTANNAAPEGIYSPGYPFRYAPQNIYAANSPAFAAETHKYIIHPRTRAPPTGDDFWLEEFWGPSGMGFFPTNSIRTNSIDHFFTDSAIKRWQKSLKKTHIPHSPDPSWTYFRGVWEENVTKGVLAGGMLVRNLWDIEMIMARRFRNHVKDVMHNETLKPQK